MKNILLSLFLVVCVTQLTAQTKKEQKKLNAQKEYNAMKEIVSSKSFEFSADWISTSGGGQINIASGSNTITVSQDSTLAAMQYFGTVTSIGFSGSEGVNFDSVMNNYIVKFDDQKNKIMVSYSVKNKSENYDVNWSIYSSGKTYVDIYSNSKSNVTYDGNTTAVKKE